MVIAALCAFSYLECNAEEYIDQYNVVWSSQSKHSGESMPVSGGNIGLNVWVENDELLIYMGQAGCRDENGSLITNFNCDAVD